MDQTYFVSADPNTAKQQEITVELHETLISLPDDTQQALCWVGSLFLTKTRDTVNDVKLTILDRMNSTGRRVSDENYDHKGRLQQTKLDLT